ncbi:hypothetical protein K402DRAFT_335851 [Aulographum hederae CBS 113979]|uniref:Wax synthase domain-containing protein n=1 Tax=Aulographum hederae CBS 113979 TaxID=1176131 RepID=A0A6G1GUX2_9PEZI|nr:hypothetical protein K402DRAFT_335851 [Aulographum hederae CBS 113979]
MESIIDDRPALPATFIPSICALIITATALPPGLLRVFATLPMAIYLTMLPLRSNVEAPFAARCSLNFAVWVLVHHYVDRVILSNPDKERWHRKINGKKDPKAPVPKTFTSRLWWALTMMGAQRGVGWSHEVKNVEEGVPAGYPRWKFVLRHLARAAWFTVVRDLYKIYTANTPYGSWGGSGKVPGSFLDSEPFLSQVFLVWIHVFMVYASSCADVSLIYAAGVAVGVFKPEECRPLFGDLRTMTSIRRTWSVTWHQLFRRINTFPSTYLVKTLLQLRPGTFLSRYSQLFLGFAVSGFMHAMAAIYTAGYECGEMRFFLSQALAIMVEDHVIEFGKYLGLGTGKGRWERRIWAVVGWVWTVAWFSWSLRDWIGRNVAEGSWEHGQVKDFGVGVEAFLMDRGLVGV